MDMSMYMTQAISTGSGGLTAQTSGSIGKLPDGMMDFETMLKGIVEDTGSPISEALNATNLLKLNLQESVSTVGTEDVSSFAKVLAQLNPKYSSSNLKGSGKGDSLNDFGLAFTDPGVTQALMKQYVLNDSSNYLDSMSDTHSVSVNLMDEAVSQMTQKVNQIFENIDYIRRSQAEETALDAEAVANADPADVLKSMVSSVLEAENVNIKVTSPDATDILDEVPKTQTVGMNLPEQRIAQRQVKFEKLPESGNRGDAKIPEVPVRMETMGNQKSSDMQQMPHMQQVAEPKQSVNADVNAFELNQLQNLGSDFTPAFQQMPVKANVAQNQSDDEVVELQGAFTNIHTEKPASDIEVTETYSQTRSQAAQPYQQVSTGVLKAIAYGQQEFTMQLNPVGLGQINVKLTKIGEKIRVDIAAVNPETHQLLLSQADSLAKELGLSHVQLDGVQVHTAEPASHSAVEATTGQGFEMSASAGQRENSGERQNAHHTAGSHHSMTAKDIESLDEMSETYQMLRAEMGRLNYLA